ncbi:MAG: CDP-alcohol phosphatidyltransferase family protein [Deltaproteobacteria bacterium]|nr:MAG: CDP-alcohol phosphatidyltransferase family protein [Deltaproteobacteria bacterium]
MTLYGLRKQADKVLVPIVRVFARIPLRANQWTLLGAVLGVAVGVAFLYGHWALGTLLFALRGIVDHIDGYVARTRNQRSTFGAVMDDVSDRWVLGVIYAGGCLNLAADYPHVLIVLGLGITGALSNALIKLSVYAESQQDVWREHGKIGHPIDSVGSFGSAEFMIYFGFGVLGTWLTDDPRPLLAGAWAVAIMSHISLLQRIWFAWRRYRAVDPVALSTGSVDDELEQTQAG